MDETRDISRSPARSPGTPVATIDIDFDDTRVAFAHRSTADLRIARALYRSLGSATLARAATALGPWAIACRLPFAERIARATVYRQFVGGRTLLEASAVVEELHARGVLSLLDYGAEGKHDAAAYNHTMNECIRALEFAGKYAGIPVVTTKLSGLCSHELLEVVSTGRPLTPEQQRGYRALTRRVDSLCHVARECGVQLYVDAEESWTQAAIDKVVHSAMLRYNGERAVIVNTYQLYLADRLAALFGHHAQCRSRSVVMGAKLVRGAYLTKERERAERTGRPSPLQADKAATDRDFDRAVAYCLDHAEDVEFVNASHNQRSAQLMIEGLAERGIPRDHPHILFCQLYGMSDNLTFNLAQAGYRVAKYLPYGPVREVIPYLVRRAQENTAVFGESKRELVLVERELRRRASALPSI